MRFDTVHLQWDKSLPPLSSDNDGARESDHSLQGQHRYRGHHPCRRALRSPVFQVGTSPTPSVFLMGGSSLRGRQPRETVSVCNIIPNHQHEQKRENRL